MERCGEQIVSPAGDGDADFSIRSTIEFRVLIDTRTPLHCQQHSKRKMLQPRAKTTTRRVKCHRQEYLIAVLTLFRILAWIRPSWGVFLTATDGSSHLILTQSHHTSS
jgi:hypothetical protein